MLIYFHMSLRLAQPVIGPINPATLLGFPDSPRDFDFYTITQHELERFEVQVEWAVGKVGLIHGVSKQDSIDQ
jgi:hypothetical protein